MTPSPIPLLLLQLLLPGSFHVYFARGTTRKVHPLAQP